MTAGKDSIGCQLSPESKGKHTQTPPLTPHSPDVLERADSIYEDEDLLEFPPGRALLEPIVTVSDYRPICFGYSFGFRKYLLSSRVPALSPIRSKVRSHPGSKAIDDGSHKESILECPNGDFSGSHEMDHRKNTGSSATAATLLSGVADAGSSSFTAASAPSPQIFRPTSKGGTPPLMATSSTSTEEDYRWRPLEEHLPENPLLDDDIPQKQQQQQPKIFIQQRKSFLSLDADVDVARLEWIGGGMCVGNSSAVGTDNSIAGSLRNITLIDKVGGAEVEKAEDNKIGNNNEPPKPQKLFRQVSSMPEIWGRADCDDTVGHENRSSIDPSSLQLQPRQEQLQVDRNSLFEEASRHEDVEDHASALECLERCLPIDPPTEDGYGPDVADVLHEIGIIHWKAGSYSESLLALQDALTIYQQCLIVSPMSTQSVVDEATGRKISKNTDADTLADVLVSFGRVHFSVGAYDNAMKYYSEALYIQTDVYAVDPLLENVLSGDNDAELPGIYENQVNTASFYKQSTPPVEAPLSPSSKRTKAKKRRKAAIDHPGIARTTICIGMVYEKRGKYARAMRYYKDGMRTQRASLGEVGGSVTNHVDLAATLNAVGALYEKTGEHALAMKYFDEALSIYRSQLGTEHPDIAVTLNNIGHVHFQRAEYEAAMHSFENALRIMKICLGESHRNVAATMHNIGLVYAACNQHEKALKLYRDVLTFQRAALGDFHFDVAVTLDSVGSAYEGQGRYDKAAKFYGKALRIRREALGREHLFVAMTLDRLGRFHLERDRDYGKAIRRLEEARVIYVANSIPADDPRVTGIVAVIEAAQNLKRAAYYAECQVRPFSGSPQSLKYASYSFMKEGEKGR